jgi:hypothetical protein
LTVGKFIGSITIEAPAVPGARVVIPLTMEIIPEPHFSLPVDKIEVESQQGLDSFTKIFPMETKDLGTYPSFSVERTESWLSGRVEKVGDKFEFHLTVFGKEAGTYQTALTITLVGAPKKLKTVSVIYTVAPPPTLTLAKTVVEMRALIGQVPPQPLRIAATSSTPDFPISVFLGVSITGLSASLSRDKAPCDIVIAFDPTGHKAGIHDFQIAVNLKGQPSQKISLRLIIHGGDVLDPIPAEIEYSYRRGGSNGGPPIIPLTGIEDVAFTLSSDKSWLYPARTQDITPARLYFHLYLDKLPEGEHTAIITLTVPKYNFSRQIKFVLTLGDIPLLVLRPAEMRFQYRLGEPAPPPQTIDVTSATTLKGSIQGYRSDLSHLFQVKYIGYSTPFQLQISLNLAKLTVGTHKGYISLTPAYECKVDNQVDLTIEVLPALSPPPVRRKRS